MIKKIYFMLLLLFIPLQGNTIGTLLTHWHVVNILGLSALCCVGQGFFMGLSYPNNKRYYERYKADHIIRTNTATNNDQANHPDKFLDSCTPLETYAYTLQRNNILKQTPFLLTSLASVGAMAYIINRKLQGSQSNISTIVFSTGLSALCLCSCLIGIYVRKSFTNPCPVGCQLQFRYPFAELT